MPTLLSQWTTDRINKLAPDNQSIQLGQQLAKQGDRAWQLVGCDDLRGWGIYQGTGKNPYQVKLDLQRIRTGEKAWDCNCRSQKSPCEHVLGLLYILVETSEDDIREREAPDWLDTWHQKLESRAIQNNDDEDVRELTPKQQAQRQKKYEKRKQKISEGLEELEQWLVNLIRRGLADPQVRSYQFWDGRAARMVDAQAPGIANWLHEMGSIPAKGTDWIEALLDQLGRLYLLIESFKRMDALSLETQADIRAVLGWHMKRNELLQGQGEEIEDTWLVIGRYTGDMRDRLKTQRVWLRGKHSERDAVIVEYIFDNQAAFELNTAPGWAFDAKLVFYPSRYPLRAFVEKRYSDDFASSPISGMSIEENIEAYAYALSQNPWLEQFPFVIENVIPIQEDNRWIVREIDGTYLPIMDSFAHKWSLLSLSGGHPIQVVGEWNGTELNPTGALENGRFVDFTPIGRI